MITTDNTVADFMQRCLLIRRDDAWLEKEAILKSL